MPYHRCTELSKLIALQIWSLEEGRENKIVPSTLSIFLNLFQMNFAYLHPEGKVLVG